jgi:hypothetical protein
VWSEGPTILFCGLGKRRMASSLENREEEKKREDFEDAYGVASSSLCMVPFAPYL